MPYPKSPFDNNFNTKILLELGDNDETTITVNEIQNNELDGVLEWLCKAPQVTTFRVNTIKNTPENARKCVYKHLCTVQGQTNFKLELHPSLPDSLILYHPKNDKQLHIFEKEIIVDTVCAAALLRGAHLYAPGVLAMLSNTQTGEEVSIYADLSRKCKKGLQKVFDGQKIFIGNGIAKMTRKDLFSEHSQATGVAVEMRETISNCPPIGDSFLPLGEGLLQNLPSIICVHVLDPQPNDTILDMCASPGNKTTHIAALMQNKGTLIAIDKTPAKVKQLKQRCKDFDASIVETIQADSTKLLSEENSRFSTHFFNKILLDAPCSALGKRPQLVISTSLKVLRSYVPLQRKLFSNAVKLLKVGGVLVYSTCTITVAENEGIVAWALKNFKSLKLIEATPMFAGPGYRDCTDLTENELKLLQRFGPNQDVDSVGFFIAKFTKVSIDEKV